MAEYNIYSDIAERSGGDIYIGVVGPVRTGKSTFIKKFMNELVIPNMSNPYQTERTRDELPQSSAGRSIMTTEPKFIPNEAVEISLGDNASLKVRMIDCVGYVVDGALGHIEEDGPRMVNTPWQEEAMPFERAAEIGTKKVICEHSTIGLVVTTDGSICEIDRNAYIAAENRVIGELKEINKPFVILLNSANPSSESTIELARELEAAHGAPVLTVNCEELCAEDINRIIETVLFEFPICEIRVRTPEWLKTLEREHWLCASVYEYVGKAMADAVKISDSREFCRILGECPYLEDVRIDAMDLGKGMVYAELKTEASLFYRVIGEISGLEIANEKNLVDVICELSKMKKEYAKIEYALNEVYEKGYGIVSPSLDELTLQEPKIIKQGGKFGVKLKASAPSIHMIRADIETEHLIYKMKMGIKSEKKYQDFEIEYRIAV